MIGEETYIFLTPDEVHRIHDLNLKLYIKKILVAIEKRMADYVLMAHPMSFTIESHTIGSTMFNDLRKVVYFRPIKKVLEDNGWRVLIQWEHNKKFSLDAEETHLGEATAFMIDEATPIQATTPFRD